MKKLVIQLIALTVVMMLACSAVLAEEAAVELPESGWIRESVDGIIKKYPSFSSLEECILVAVEFAESNKRAILHIYRSVDRDIFERYLWKTCDYAVRKYGDTVFCDRKVNESDKNIMLQYYKCECFGQIMAWMESGMKDDIRTTFHRLCVLKQGHAEEMIVRSQQ